MKKLRLLLTLALAVSGLNLGAEIVATPDLVSPIRQNLNWGPSLEVRPGIYRFTRNADIEPTAVIAKGKVEENIEGVGLSTIEGEAVHVSTLPSGEIKISYHLSNEERGQLPDQVIVSKQEFGRQKLSFVADGEVSTLGQWDSGYAATEVASLSGRTHLQTKKHRVGHFRISRNSPYRTDANGRPVGEGGNCVTVVCSKTGVCVPGNGKDIASHLIQTGKYQQVSTNARIPGMVCSWKGGWHGKGHAGYFDGQCFVPTYNNNCGDPGDSYNLSICAAPKA